MNELTTFMNAMSFNDLGHFESILISESKENVGHDWTAFTKSLIQFSPKLDYYLQQELVTVLYNNMMVLDSSSITAEMSHYSNIVKMYNIIKTYLIKLSSNNMLETPELNASLDITQYGIMEEFIDLIKTMKQKTIMNPYDDIYSDFNIYSREMLTILNALIDNLIEKYEKYGLHICAMSFNKRLKLLVIAHNIIMIIYYLLIHYQIENE